MNLEQGKKQGDLTLFFILLEMLEKQRKCKMFFFRL